MSTREFSLWKCKDHYYYKNPSIKRYADAYHKWCGFSASLEQMRQELEEKYIILLKICYFISDWLAFNSHIWLSNKRLGHNS